MKHMARRTVLAFLFLAALGAFCAGVAKADPDDDAAFLDTVSYYGVAPGYSTYSKIVEAHGVCRAFAIGASTTDVILAVAADFNESRSHAAYFTGASTQTYCPQYNIENRRSYVGQHSSYS